MLRHINNAVRKAAFWASRKVVPPRGRILAYGALHRLTRSPEYGFRQAAILQRGGEPDAAARIYEQLMLWNHTDQQVCFKAGRLLWEMGRDRVVDPLFSCRVDSISSGPQCAEFRIDFVYAGLWMFLQLRADQSTSAPSAAAIRLDGVLVRRHRLTWLDGRASFQFIFKRATLAHLPKQGRLTIELEQEGAPGRDVSLASAVVRIPHGDGSLFQRIESCGLLEKKGELRPDPDALRRRQDAYLGIYERASQVFEDEFGRKLFLLYGTLLGQHRGADFIPGDDDFDVGYVSLAATPREVKRETMHLMRVLVSLGFKVVVNRFGRPFRLTEPNARAGVHLDVRPVWTPGDSHVWMHKHAHLEMDLDEFRSVIPGGLRGVPVWKPSGTERFLELYYGQNWRLPDPGFSNSGKLENGRVRKGLDACCLTTDEQKQLASEVLSLQNEPGSVASSGEFVPIALEPPYPLHVHQSRVS